ncbi:unnamed protein product [Rotaria socialis]
MSVIAHNSSKRVLSPMADEQRESTEMDNDPGTRIVSTAQRKRRAVGVSPSNKIQDNGLSISNQARHMTEQDIRDNLVVEDLCKFAKDKHQFTIDIAGYRRTSTNSAHGEYKILLFV